MGRIETATEIPAAADVLPIFLETGSASKVQRKSRDVTTTLQELREELTSTALASPLALVIPH